MILQNSAEKCFGRERAPSAGSGAVLARRNMSSRILRLLRDDSNILDISTGQTISGADAPDSGLMDEATFCQTIAGERRRTDRSTRPFLLMLVESRDSLRAVNGNATLLSNVALLIKSLTRETDSAGWYENDLTIGVIFTEVSDADDRIVAAILAKISNGLRSQMTAEQMDRLKISLYRYPNGGQQPPKDLDHLVLYPDLASRHTKNRAGRFLKRAMDVLTSMLLLVLLSPLLLIIVIAIRLTSKGPVLFRQDRIGEHGVPFTFLKFRSMRVDSDSSIHKEYVSRLISGEQGGDGPDGKESGAVYKITRDPRVTTVGRFLRRSSLDELPQLWNVFKGEMSLVGPRPPIPYEFERYDPWHRRRVLEAKPGITGLWQVTGRSRTSFDDMVRLDLKYVLNWSLWLDLEILLQTPRAVLSGDGAY